jgi:NAD(P)-dependent dehydrogenase (short-subunit alcohol dehydrogenase family)
MKGGRIKGQGVLLTGASGGIGRATALRFAACGARLVLVSRNSTGDLERLADEIRNAGGDATAVAADVSSRAEVAQLVADAQSRLGCIDIVVCNAGEYLRRPVKDLSYADIERMMAINFYGTVHIVQAILPQMLAQKHGHIVAVTSVDGRKGLPPDGAYVAAKFATTGFMEVLRQELWGSGVYASTVLPGRVDTGMLAQLEVPRISAKISSDRVARAILRAVVQKRREIIVPFWGPKALLVMNAFSTLLGDLTVRYLRLAGTLKQEGRDS